MKEHLVAREAPAADEGEAERGEAVECRQLGVWPPGRDVEQDGHAHRHAHAERRGAREKPGCEEKPADQLRQRGAPWPLVGDVVAVGLPVPTLFATLAALTQLVGGLLLAAGLFTRPSALGVSAARP